MLLTRVANENPAIGQLQSSSTIVSSSRAPVTATRSPGSRGRSATDRPSTQGTSLLELIACRAPAPTSLAAQLRFVRARWGVIVGESLEELIRRMDIAIGILAEEERALHLRFGGGGGGGDARGRGAGIRRRRR